MNVVEVVLSFKSLSGHSNALNFNIEKVDWLNWINILQQHRIIRKNWLLSAAFIIFFADTSFQLP